METNQNMFELKDDFTQNNMVNNLDLFDNQKITETIYDPNAITNQEPIKDQNIAFPPSTDFNQNTAEEVPYTFIGEFNFDSNSRTASQIKNSNVGLFMNNKQNVLNSATTNTLLVPRNQFEVPKTDNLNTNLNTDNFIPNTNTNLPGAEEKYTFDGNIFDLNNNMNPSTEINYTDNANIFNNNNFNMDVNNNNMFSNQTNQDNNFNNNFNVNFTDFNDIINTDYANTIYRNNNNNNNNQNSNVHLLNVLTFGEQDKNVQPIIENPQAEFTENQNVYHEYNNEQPKIENEQINLNDNNNNNIIEKGNEQKDKENFVNSLNNDNHIESPFATLKENKTVLVESEPKIENDNNNKPEEKLEPFPVEKKDDEVNNNQNINDIQLTNNNSDNIEEPPKIEEKKEENKLVDISDEIKEIKEMPEKPFEQRDVIFNKNNIKVIKIEDDETTFCSGLFAPLFKKLFG